MTVLASVSLLELSLELLGTSHETRAMTVLCPLCQGLRYGQAMSQTLQLPRETSRLGKKIPFTTAAGRL